MFRKVLIANRGEIAVRIAATCQTMGIVAAAVYSDADAGGLHVRAADEAYRIGAAPASCSYLNVEAIMEAARRAGADALHPGYGFLAENPALAEACREAGVTFVGPSPEAMRLLGSKIAAKRLAETVGVPTVPGYLGDDQGNDTLLERARELGVPLLVKAAAGGGGRGMRVVRDLSGFAEALTAARREALAAFGDDTVLLERFIEHPRHVEFQIFGDAHGRVVHLGERECSIQRRHQKIVEEAPSPAVSPTLRSEMGAAALRVAHHAGYANAGTAEFMLAPDGSYYFLEMNARLQVEHPVTELVTGYDLVALQLRVAAGEPLPFTQDEVDLHGHAVECRIYAEDPAAGFLPSTGRLLAFEAPRGPGLRVDTGVETGDDVTVDYDPMLAKLIAWGETRHEALQRGVWALERSAVLGVTTNLPFLALMLRHPSFVSGELSTSFIEQHFGDGSTTGAPSHAALLLAALRDATDPIATDTSGGDPWRAATGWTLTASRHMTFVNGLETFTVELSRGNVPLWNARIGDDHYDVTAVERNGPTGLTIIVDGRVLHGHVAGRGELFVAHGGEMWALRRLGPPDIDVVSRAAGAGAGDSARGVTVLKAPMPGTVIKVHVDAGHHVEERQRVLVLEAMKMEHVVEAPYSGLVRTILHHEGDKVVAGEPLVELAEG